MFDPDEPPQKALPLEVHCVLQLPSPTLLVIPKELCEAPHMQSEIVAFWPTAAYCVVHELRQLCTDNAVFDVPKLPLGGDVYWKQPIV